MTFIAVSDSIAGGMEKRIKAALDDVARLAERYGYSVAAGKHDLEELKVMMRKLQLAQESALEMVRTYAQQQHEAGIELGRNVGKST